MKFKRFSPKQLDVITGDLARYNILSGSVRSGKTMAANIRWTLMLRELGPGDLLMTGVTKHTIKRNVLNDLFELWGRPNYSYDETEGVITAFGRRIYVVGAQDAKSTKRIQGMSIAGYYGDEEANKPEDFFHMARTRMDKAYSTMIVTTNPDNPYHWLKKFMDDQKLKEQGLLKVWQFTLDDNYALDEVTKNALKNSFHGVFYRRYILGEWCVAEGIIYDMFDEKAHTFEKPRDEYDEYVVSVDYGVNNPMVFLLFGVWWEGETPHYHLLREYYYDSNEDAGSGQTLGQKTDAQFYADLERFIGDTPVDFILIDPSAASFKAEIRYHGKFTVRDAVNDVENGIRAVQQALYDGRYMIHRSCQNTIREKMTYMWDPRAAERGKDEPLKKNDHTQDAERYLIYYYEGGSRPNVRVFDNYDYYDEDEDDD